MNRSGPYSLLFDRSALEFYTLQSGVRLSSCYLAIVLTSLDITCYPFDVPATTSLFHSLFQPGKNV